MTQQDINPYNPNEFEKYFKNTSLYKKIYNDHDIICFKSNPDYYNEYTGRFILSSSIFNVSPLYYFQYLLDLNPTKIYDIGCGANIFKKYIPNIVGLDISYSKGFKDNGADEYLEMDDNFYERNFEKMESAFAINSLHYYPISLIRDRVIQFSSLISKGGRGFISLNAARMFESQFEVEMSEIQMRVAPRKRLNQIENLIRTQLEDLPFKIEVFECLIHEQFDSYLNGNVRIVFTK